MTGSGLADCLLRWLLRLCAPLVIVCVGALLVFLVRQGWPSLSPSLVFGSVPALDALLGRQAVWDGLWPACAGTFCLVALAAGMALFPGIGCGLYLAEFAPPRRACGIRLAMDVLAGTPSIVMGLFGFTLILFLRKTLLPEANTSLFLSAACLALLVTPVLAATTAESLAALPASLRVACQAMGFTKRQCARHVLLPCAMPGIAGGVVLAVARAAEDTAVIMLTGAVANAGLPAGLWGRFEALPFSIYYTSAQYQGASLLEKRFRRRWQGGG